MADLKNTNPGISPKGGDGAQGFRLVGFPREFEKSFRDHFESRFWSILIVTWVLLYAFALLMSNKQWQFSEQDRQEFKQTYLRQLYAEIVAPETPTVEEGEGAGIGPAAEEAAAEEELSEEGQRLVEESVSERVQRREAGAGARRTRRQQMEQEAAGYGVLAALTASGEGGSGDVAYSDILGGAGGSGAGLSNAGDLVSGTAALQAGTREGQRSRIAKGGGFGDDVGEGGIDDLVSGTGVGGGESVARRGTIKLAQGTEVAGSGASASQRNPDVVDAVINQNKASVEYCYQSQLKVDPNLRGEIFLSFDILPSGRVGSVKIFNSTLNNSKVEKCIVRSVRRWSNFPKLQNARGVVTIRTKFIFGYLASSAARLSSAKRG